MPLPCISNIIRVLTFSFLTFGKKWKLFVDLTRCCGELYLSVLVSSQVYIPCFMTMRLNDRHSHLLVHSIPHLLYVLFGNDEKMSLLMRLNGSETKLLAEQTQFTSLARMLFVSNNRNNKNIKSSRLLLCILKAKGRSNTTFAARSPSREEMVIYAIHATSRDTLHNYLLFL